MIQSHTKNSGFEHLGIAPKLQQIIDRLGYTVPTPIQDQAIPIAMDGKDVLGIAQTGTGKTLAFAVPLIQRLAKFGGMGLILAPTRELALQIDEVFQALGRSIGVRTAVLIGGASMNNQIRDINRKPHVIIATPGRLIDHLQQKTVRLDTVMTLILDEADRMLDMGFEPQIKIILRSVPQNRQTLLFSATMPAEIWRIANTYMRTPVRIEIAKSGTMAELVTQEVYAIAKNDKLRLLEWILKQPYKSVLLFSRTKYGAKKITKAVHDMGYKAAEIHSNRSLAQRREALDGFKSGRYRVLVGTDIAARGIDVTGISLVINYDLPDVAEDYVHRIGRTGRAGEKGHAISFASPDQGQEVRAIEKLTGKILPMAKLPELPPQRGSYGASPRPFAFQPRTASHAPVAAQPHPARRVGRWRPRR